MPRHPSDPELKTEFAAKIQEIFGRGVGAKEIAKKLGVTPQSVYGYRKAKVAPSPEVIRRAMEEWQIQLSYRGRALSLADFGAKPAPKGKRAEQYELWEAIKKLGPDSVRAEILDRQSTSLQVALRIVFRKR